MRISKENYFYLQTDDLLCKLYGILIGAPVLWIDENYKIIAYNYDKITQQNNYINIVNSDEINIDDRNYSIIHRRLNEDLGYTFGIKTPTKFTNKLSSLERIYYNKYIKYKTKYIKLKLISL